MAVLPLYVGVLVVVLNGERGETIMPASAEGGAPKQGEWGAQC